MSIDKLRPQYLNLDADERFVKGVEMADAQNVRVGEVDGQDGGVIKTVEGNTAISPKTAADTLPATGDNKTVGVCEAPHVGFVYFMNHNSLGNHGVYRYDVRTNKYESVLVSTLLDVTESDFVKMDLIVQQNEDHFLFWTTGRGEPRRINVGTAMNGGYSNATSFDSETMLAAVPPYRAPIAQYESDESIPFNRLKNVIVQFCAAHKYEDGDVSALGPISSAAVSETNMKFDLNIRGVETVDNCIRVTMSDTDTGAEETIIYARYANFGPWYEVGRVDGTEIVDFKFANDGVYTILSQEEQNKLYNAVPRSAKAQTVQDGRLLFGNYIEGYSAPNVAGEVHAVYNQAPELPTIQINSDDGKDYDETDDPQEDPDITLQTKRIVRTIFNNEYTFGGDWAVHNDVNLGPDEIAFTISLNDLQQPPAVDTELNVRVGVTMDEFGIGNFYRDAGGPITEEHARYMIYLSDTDDDGQNPSDEYGFAILTPKEIGSIQNASYYEKYESLANLAPASVIEFNELIEVETAETLEEYGSNFLQQMIGSKATVPVLPKGWTGEPDVSNATTQAKRVEFASPGDVDLRLGDYAGMYGSGTFPMTLWLGGAVEWEIFSGNVVLTESGVDVRFRVRLAGVDLDVLSAAHSVTASGWNLSVSVIKPLVRGSLGPDSTNNMSAAGGDVPDLPIREYDFGIDSSGNFSSPATDAAHRHTLRTATVGFSELYSEVDFVSALANSGHTYKSGMTHNFGIVYRDYAGRPCGVQEIDSVFSETTGSEARGGAQGRVEVDLQLSTPAPDWARSYSIVYREGAEIERFWQYLISEAAYGGKTDFVDIRSNGGALTRPIITGSQDPQSGKLYLSMRSVEGKDSSYKELKGGRVDYQYQEGDYLRVVSYVDEGGTIKTPNLIIPITGYNYYVDNDENPIQVTNLQADETDDYRRTGWFLEVRDPNVVGFNISSVAGNIDNFSQRCVIEIVRPGKVREDAVWYEIHSEACVLGSFSSAIITAETVQPISREQAVVTFSDGRWRVGDEIVVTGLTNSGVSIVTDMQPQIDGTYIVTVGGGLDNLFNSSALNTSVFNVVGSPVGTLGLSLLNTGNSYFRVREQLASSRLVADEDLNFQLGRFNPADIDGQTYINIMVEDDHASDFFQSNIYSYGNPYLKLEDEAEVRRSASVTYSDVTAFDLQGIKYHSFNPALFPYKDYQVQNGAIEFIESSNEALRVYQQNKVSNTPVNRQLIESASGGQLVTSSNVLGTEVYYAGEFGPVDHPESVMSHMGRSYFIDKQRGKIVAVTSGGITPISEKNVDSFFESASEQLREMGSAVDLPTGYDFENDEVLFTLNGRDLTDVIADGETIATVALTSGGGQILTDIEMVRPPVRPWEDETFDWDGVPVDFDDHCNGLLVLDEALVSPALVLGDILPFSTVMVITSDGEYMGTTTWNSTLGLFNIPSTMLESDGTNDTLTYTASSNTRTERTAAYAAKSDVWLTFYDMTPERWAKIGSKLLSFKGGAPWLHNSNALHGSFYGTEYDASLKVVSKINPSMVKNYKSISIEGNSAWDVAVENTEQSTRISEEGFTEREGMHYAAMPKDLTASSTLNTSNIVVLGKVTNISGNSVIFDTRVSNLPFGIGDSLYKIEASATTSLSATITGVKDRLALTTSDSSAFTVDDVVVAVSDASINGDDIRDYYITIELTGTGTDARELYAVNAVFAPSPLHNEKVN